MTIQDKISQLLPSFLKRYDGNKNTSILLPDEGTLERYQKMLASEIDAFFLESTDNLHENTKAVTMPTKFLPYEEDLRGTSKLIFEFVPFVPAIPFDQTNLVFDFDFQATAKQTLRDDIYLTSYIDRGVSMVQATASAQPIIDAIGLKFDGIDFMNLGIVPIREIWLVCNSLDGAVFDFYDTIVSATSSPDNFSIQGNNTISALLAYFSGIKVNNVNTLEFAILSNFKSISQTTAFSPTPLDIGSWNGLFGWNGYIKRILIFDEILSESRRMTLQEYLAYTYTL